MAKRHDVKIWDRIVEAFTDIGVAGNPTAIARELGMAQPSVRQWQLGETTPSRAHIRDISRLTGYLTGYLEDEALPKKAPKDWKPDPGDLLLREMIALWARLSKTNKTRLIERAEALLDKQFPDDPETDELQRRPG